MVTYKCIVENPKVFKTVKPKAPNRLFWLLALILGLCALWILYSHIYVKVHHPQSASDLNRFFYKSSGIARLFDPVSHEDELDAETRTGGAVNKEDQNDAVNEVDQKEITESTLTEEELKMLEKIRAKVQTNIEQGRKVSGNSEDKDTMGNNSTLLEDIKSSEKTQIKEESKISNTKVETDKEDGENLGKGTGRTGKVLELSESISTPQNVPGLENGSTPEKVPPSAKVPSSANGSTPANRPTPAKVPSSASVPAGGVTESSGDYGTCARVMKDEERFDCFPGDSPDAESCTKRGCCWKVSNNSKVPACFYPQGLQTYRILQMNNHSYGLEVYWQNLIPSPYGGDIRMLKMSVRFETAQRLHVKITDANATRYEPTLPEVPMVNSRVKTADCLYDVIVTQNQTGFAVLRRSDKSVIFDSRSLGGFTFAHQFLQISAKLDSPYLYGLGEHRNRFLLDTQWSTVALWALDGSPQDHTNGYGTHPFLLGLEEGAARGSAYGVYLRSSSALEFVLQPTPAITYRALGGILDFYFFLGPSPADVVSQYQHLVGRPELPPYWSLGFHLCRWGYKNLTDLQGVIERNVKAGIPLDTVWMDIDYMEGHNNFVLSKSFDGLKEYVQDLHKSGRHFIPIVDPAVASREGASYLPYVDGIERGIFVKNASGQPMEGRVWNAKGGSVFPDFSNPDTNEYWTLQLLKLHNQFEFDGLWIDMNEPSNFVNGALQGCSGNSTYENPPYVPHIAGRSLNFKTLCMEGRHFAGIHYDLHNMYGALEAVATNIALKEIRNQRSLIISRSTYSGQGRYSGHWTGDILSTYDDMKQSVADLMSFNLFGIPMVGSDICGFIGDSDPGLCQRWLQLGAFYPFSRSHNDINSKPQDPAYFSPDVIASTITAYRIRYSLLPYLYSLFYRATLFGETVVRPLLLEFPRDHNTYSLANQFLWGPGLLISPVLEKDQTFAETYLPAGLWYDYHTRHTIKSPGQSFVIKAPNSTIPLFLRGGYVLPAQSPDVTTTLSRKNPMYLLASLNETGQATGILYWDDGESLNTWEQKKVTVVEFKLANQSLSSIVLQAGYTAQPMKLASVTVLGVTKQVTKVTVNGKKHTKFNMDQEVLTVNELGLELTKTFTITWI